MNARSKFIPIMRGLFFKSPSTEDVTNRAGRVKFRTIKHYTGFNKGRRYPYASKRQLERVYRDGN